MNYVIELKDKDTGDLVAKVVIEKGCEIPEGLGIFGRLYDLPLKVQVWAHRSMGEALEKGLPAAEDVTPKWFEDYCGFRRLLAPLTSTREADECSTHRVDK